MTLRFPAGVDEQGFLSQYWQRKPLLLPNALSDRLPAITPDELAGLACADDAEARLLHSAGPATQWQLQHGPFQDRDFEKLPARDWTLLVQDVDKFVPAVADLLRHFAFIPSWRIDDVMISYATPGGTVGPHIDQYDVFLIQGSGRRVWETGNSNGAFIADLPVRVLEEFDVEQRWELNTGDVLYLPPGLAHHGHSDVACMTLSVGFRAPTVQELILSQAEYRAGQARGRYHDADLCMDEADDGLISAAAIQRARRLLGDPVGEPADTAIWFGQLLTENKPWLTPPPIDMPESKARFTQRLDTGEPLQKHPAVRMAHSLIPGHGMLFVDGAAWPLTAANRSLVRDLCRGQVLTPDLAGESGGELLYRLYCDGKLYFVNGDRADWARADWDGADDE